MFTIEYAEGVGEDIKRLTAHRRKIILDSIEMHLQDEPNVETRRRKRWPDWFRLGSTCIVRQTRRSDLTTTKWLVSSLASLRV